MILIGYIKIAWIIVKDFTWFFKCPSIFVSDFEDLYDDEDLK